LTRRTDPIDLEVLRARLEAVTDEAGAAIERTAISPVVTEGKDYSATLTDAAGRLIAGGGFVPYHWWTAAHAVRSTLARYGPDAIRPGDVYIANDPHAGGGLHPQDVMVQRPIFTGGRLVAWAGVSAHMMDFGGLAAGSFAPAATECYQEALRLPSVRLLRAGEEVSEVWDIIRNNVRYPTLIEMDLRSLVAGSHVAAVRMAELVLDLGADAFAEQVDALLRLSEEQIRRAIAAISDGTYRATTWTEWGDAFFRVPCRLTVSGSDLTFDFEGAAPQAPHFFNTKPFIVTSAIMTRLTALLVPTLPYNEGLFAPLDVRCPPGSVVDAQPPAPIAAAHVHVALNAAETALQCVRLALGASPPSAARDRLTGWGGSTALGLSTWSGIGLDGNPDGWMMLDGSWPGSSAGVDRDGIDVAGSLIGSAHRSQFQDIEILEAWYPILITEKRVRRGVNGAGRHRSGGGTEMGFVAHGTGALTGEMLASRRWLPLEGAAGGAPGATTELRVRRADGTIEPVATNAAGVPLPDGGAFEFRCASGGGFGDPLDRDPDVVTAEVRTGLLGADVALAVYGVVVDGPGTTAATRARRRRERLAVAAPPEAVPEVAEREVDEGGNEPAALYPGIERRGPVARVARTGTPLAVAPDHWTTGCPVLEARLESGGPVIVTRSYLDPSDGTILHTEVVPGGESRAFSVLPDHWTSAAGRSG